MTDDKLAFLDQPRDDQGRFANKEIAEPAKVLETPPPPEVAPPAEPPPAPTPTPPPQQAPPTASAEPPEWTIAKALDERDKRQKLERELEDVKRKYEDATRKPQQPLDPIADPEGFDKALQGRIEAATWDAITRTTRMMAARHHGEDSVKAAEEWLANELQTNPAFFQTITRQPDPYDFVVRQHKRSLTLSKLGEDDFDTAARKWAEANGYTTQPRPAEPSGHVGTPSPQPGTPPPRPSLASAPSAGGKAPNVPIGQGVAFEGVFKH